MRELKARRLTWLVIACGIMIVLLAGCDLSPQTTISPESDFADKIQFLLKLTFFAGVAVFAIVETVLFIAVFRFRERPGDTRIPPQIHGNTPIEVAWTAVPALILIGIAIPTTKIIFETQAQPPKDALQVRVIGHQWWWEFQYPTLGITTANELHLPVNTTASFDLESADVQHSFWLPRLGGKRDLIPNHTNHLWWTAREIGTTPGQCAQYCGTSHANMRMDVVVQSKADFDTWVKDQTTKPTPATTGLAAQGEQVFKSQPCVGCHTIDGVSQGTVGPNLSHVSSRSTIASGILENNPQDLAAWLKDPPGEKPGSIMPNLHLSEADVNALVAYLDTLK